MRLPDDEDWLYGPAYAEPPLCSYDALHDGRLRLADVAKMNDQLAARAENRVRAHKAAEDAAAQARGNG